MILTPKDLQTLRPLVIRISALTNILTNQLLSANYHPHTCPYTYALHTHPTLHPLLSTPTITHLRLLHDIAQIIRRIERVRADIRSGALEFNEEVAKMACRDGERLGWLWDMLPQISVGEMVQRFVYVCGRIEEGMVYGGGRDVVPEVLVRFEEVRWGRGTTRQDSEPCSPTTILPHPPFVPAVLQRFDTISWNRGTSRRDSEPCSPTTIPTTPIITQVNPVSPSSFSPSSPLAATSTFGIAHSVEMGFWIRLVSLLVVMCCLC